MDDSVQASVLVVDDNEFVLETVAVILAGADYRVVSCNSAEKALFEFNAHRFDVILTDFNLPGLSGIDFIKKVRLRDSDVPIVIMTAYMESFRAVDEISEKVFDSIAKPFRPEKILCSIRNAVNFYRHKMAIKKLEVKKTPRKAP